MSDPHVTARVRPSTAADADAVRHVVTEAFADEGPLIARLCTALDDGGHTRVVRVAEVNNEVVGHVQLSRCWVDARDALVEVLVLSPLSVLPGHQGSGVGSLLVESALAAAAAGSWPAVFLEGAPEYYGRLGFAAAGPLGFGRPSARIPEAAFQVAVQATHRPWMTGRLVYCDPFWALDCVGLRDPVLAELEERYRL